MPGTLIRDSMSACATAVRNDVPVGISSAIELLMGVEVKVTGCTQAGGDLCCKVLVDLVLFKVKMSSRIEEFIKKSVPRWKIAVQRLYCCLLLLYKCVWKM